MNQQKSDELQKFVKERNEALFSFDPVKIKVFARKYVAHIPEDPRVFWGGVYKAVCNITNAPEDAVRRAEEGLKELGMSRGFD